MNMLKSMLPALLCLSWTIAAQAGGTMTVEQAWSRPALAGRTGVVYLRLRNQGAADRLLGADTSVAARAELHQTTNDHGIMRMRPLDAAAGPGGCILTLAPGGVDLMRVGLKQALSPGARFALTLQFEKAGAVVTEVQVGTPGGAGAEPDGAMKMN